MTHLQVLMIATCTWIVWCPAAALQSAAGGGSGHVSVFPALPVFPLFAWGLAYWLQTKELTIGVALVGVAHLALLALMLVSIVRSRRTLRQAGTRPKRSDQTQ